MNHQKLAAVLFAPIFLLACSPTPQSDINFDDPFQNAQPHWLDPSAIDDAKSVAMSGQVNCQSRDPSQCSPSVGMLVTLATSTSVSECTAFLVAPQIAITNSHCIPADLKKSGSACNDRVWLYFPDLNGFPQLRTGCSRILTATSLPEQASAVPDYAVIQLDQVVERPVLKMSRDGFKDGADYKIVKIDPQSSSAAVGSMIQTTCKAIHNSIIVPYSDDNKSTNMAMADCEIVHGNSGSPLLDSQGQVQGVIQLTFEPEALTSNLDKQSVHLLASTIARMGGGTAFACMDLPAEVPAASLDPRCAAITATRDPKVDPSKVLLEKVGERLEIELKRISASLSHDFQWEFIKSQNGSGGTIPESSSVQNIIPVPSCIQDMKALLVGPSMDLTLPLLSLEMGLNHYLVIDYRLSHAGGSVASKLAYSVDDLNHNGTSKFVLSENSTGLPHEFYSQSLGQCQATVAEK